MLEILGIPYIRQIGKYKRKYIQVKCSCGRIFDTRHDTIEQNGNCIECKKLKPFDKNLSFNLELAKNAIIIAYNDGNSLDEIANVYKCTRHTIRDRLKKWGIIISDDPRFFGKASKVWKGYEEISGTYFSQIKISAKEREMEMNLSIEFLWDLFLKQNRKCALSGVEIQFANCRTRGDETTASLDRIDSSKGYTEDNVQWVHKVIQRMKMDLKDDEFIEWCRTVFKYNVV